MKRRTSDGGVHPTLVRPFRYEDAAWRHLARQYTEPLPPRRFDFDNPLPEMEPTRRGLCYAVMSLYIHGRIDWKMYGRMRHRLDQFVPIGTYAYESDRASNDDFAANREARVLAALWLTLDSQIDR